MNKQKTNKRKQFKIIHPDHEGRNMVSSCCGGEYEHDDYITCSECYKECNIIEENEYNNKLKK